jgi:hypothetical protein
MKRFIDLTNQICDGEREFAFYCTVRGVFETFSQAQTWSSVEQFKQDYDSNDLERYLNLIPDDWEKKESEWKNVEVHIFGKKISSISSINYNKEITLTDLEMELGIALQNEQYELCEAIKKKIELLKTKQ